MPHVPAPSRARPAGDPSPGRWVGLLVVYSITSLVEGIGVSQIFAFMPLYLQGMGLSAAAVGHWVGLLSALVFVLGLPIVPLWGVWADRYSRKAVIVRSAFVETAVFALVALARTPGELAGALLLVGFQLGNTGVMLAALREVVPPARLGTAVALFGASSPAGFAVGPLLGGPLMVDRLHAPLADVYWVAAALSALVGVMLLVASREVRPRIAPQGTVLRLAYGAVRGVVADRRTRRIFSVFALAFLGRQIMAPYLPILVQRVNGPVGVTGAVGLVTGVSALVGALVSPAAGILGDRVGLRRVLVGVLAASAVSVAAMPAASTVRGLALIAVAVGALWAAAQSMIYGILALETPAVRRSATLNLALLPLYLTGIAGPAIGAGLFTAGLGAVFVAAGAFLLLAVPLAAQGAAAGVGVPEA